MVLGFFLLYIADAFSHCSYCLIRLIFMSFHYGHLAMVIYNTGKADRGSDTSTAVFRGLDSSSVTIHTFS